MYKFKIKSYIIKRYAHEFYLLHIANVHLYIILRYVVSHEFIFIYV